MAGADDGSDAVKDGGQRTLRPTWAKCIHEGADDGLAHPFAWRDCRVELITAIEETQELPIEQLDVRYIGFAPVGRDAPLLEELDRLFGQAPQTKVQWRPVLWLEGREFRFEHFLTPRSPCRDRVTTRKLRTGVGHRTAAFDQTVKILERPLAVCGKIVAGGRFRLPVAQELLNVAEIARLPTGRGPPFDWSHEIAMTLTLASVARRAPPEGGPLGLRK